MQLVKEQRAYRKEAPVIWDTKFQTAIAQAELEDVEKETFFNDIVFKVDGSDEELTVATTRPELLAACVAVFIHPDTKKYQHLFGKYAISPLYNVKVPILPDEDADPEKGTGVVMCCTFGDQKDIEWYKKHQLPLKMVITHDGKMNESSGKYAGMKIEDARKQVIEDLKEAGLLTNQKKIMHAVNVGERSGRPVEIINSKQWYIKYLDQREDFLKGAEELHWVPSHMKHRVDHWIKGLNWDWSISRQRHFGIPIPVWYDKEGNVYYADESQLPVDPLVDRPLSAPEGIELTPESDVFDTWFTSSSTPFIATGLLDGAGNEDIQKKVFPMDLRPQAHDIINTWLFYTMAKTRLIHKGVNPWRDTAISGHVQDPQGKKMSKSKGNVVVPQEMMEKYSADALRFAAASTKLGQDIPFQEKELATGIKVANKLYNAHKFASMLLEGYTPSEFNVTDLRSIDQWIISKAQSVAKKAQEAFDKYEFHTAKALMEQFFMQDIADNYIEIVKQRLWKPEEVGKEETLKAQHALYTALYTALRGLAPIMPFITEEIYQQFNKVHEEHVSIHVAPYPEYNEVLVNTTLEQEAQAFLQVVGAARKFKAEHQLSMKEELSKATITCSQEEQTMIEDSLRDLKAVTSLKEVEFKQGKFAVAIER